MNAFLITISIIIYTLAIYDYAYKKGKKTGYEKKTRECNEEIETIKEMFKKEY